MLKIKQIDGLSGALSALVPANTVIDPDTKCKITYDENGLVTAGADLAAADIPDLDAAKIRTGTLEVDRIPVLPTTKITSGIFGVVRGGTGKSSVTAGSFLKGAGTSAMVERTPTEVKEDLSLNLVTNHKQVKAAANSTVNNIPQWDAESGDILKDGLSLRLAIDGIRDITTASDTALATEKAIRKAISEILSGSEAMVFKGVIDCSLNPNYPAADIGDVYRVSVAGKIGGAQGPNVEVGDTLIAMVSDATGGDHATVGSKWTIIQSNIDGAVTGPDTSTDAHIAVFDGGSGKVIKDGGVTIDALKTSITNQRQDAFPGVEAAANAVANFANILQTTPQSNTSPVLYVNGLFIERGTYGALATNEWAFSGQSVQCKLPYALDVEDRFVVVYKY